MKKPVCVLFVVCFGLFGLYNLSLSAQITLDSDEQFHYAVQTMNSGEYQQAIAEFLRFIDFFQENKKVPKAHYLIGYCHLKSREYQKARDVLDRVQKTYESMPIAGKALFLIGESYYRQGFSEEAERYFALVIRKYQDPQLINGARFRIGWSRLKQDRWKEASETFKKVERGSPFYAKSLDLSKRSLEGEFLPHKEPTTAGFMAAMLPGLGHVYTKRYQDATVAFLLNGLFIWGAIEAFNEDLDVLGGLLLFVEAGWYAGNIYSAVNAAHKYNKKAKDEFRQGLSDQLDLNLLVTREGHLGLAVTFDF